MDCQNFEKERLNSDHIKMI